MLNSSALGRLPRVPASFFGIVLGLAGLGNAWRAAHTVWALPTNVGEGFYAAAFLVWFLLVILYVLKWIVDPAVAKEEARHTIQCCFIGLGGVATMLIAQGATPYSEAAAISIYILGVTFTTGFALWRTGYLWRGDRDPATTTPVLYLPMVAGSFVASNVAAGLGWYQFAELAFGAAFFSWLGIESVLLHRLYTASPMAPALRPTLGIQLAPPTVGAVSYLSIGGGHADLFATMLVGYALVQALLLTRMIRWIAEQPFAASYWAFTFGATALASAAIRLSVEDQDGAFAVLAPVLFVVANLVVLGIAAGTIRLLAIGKLFPAAALPATGMTSALAREELAVRPAWKQPVQS